ncbi:hypothetical protein HK101_005988 [Irineochytrium annulatum]|nr:hypothetical protein HK101_005988 [Irineochytrium annulatum]
MSPKSFLFGKWSIPPLEVFFTSRLSLGLVNLKPVAPGHVLVIPRRVVARYADLTRDEIEDLFISAQTIGRVVEKEFGGESLTITVQDGPMAGQTVAHVHVHVIPRKKGDWANNDDIYREIDDKSKEFVKAKAGPDVEERKDRTMEEMGKEAEGLRGLFDQFEDVWK